jgi:ribosome-associated protein
MGKKKKETSEKLLSTIVDAIVEKKGVDIVSLELGKLPNAICKYFVICNADSTTQVSAIADNVEDRVIEHCAEKVWQKGGYENSIWIILDYVDVVVHIFQTEWRQFYKLEGLWADATRINYDLNDLGKVVVNKV